MPIQFQCPECDNILEVPEGSEGQQAKCPACSAVVDVPRSQAHDPERRPETHDPVNPYRSTSKLEPDGTSSLDPSGELTVQPIDVGWTLNATWELFKVHFGILIGIFMIMVAAGIVTSVGLLIFRLAVIAIAGEVPQPGEFTPIMIGVSIFENLINQVVSLWFTIGASRIMLQISRNQPADLGLLLQSAPFFIRTFLATLLFVILLIGGLILFIIPGIYVVLTYWNYTYFIVDRNCGVLEAFRLAKVHASGNRLSIFVIGLIISGLGLLGILACCLGWIATSPFCMLLLVISYLTMTGQPFVQPRTVTNEQA
ncbi:MAG TPA: hypothetical protein DEF45_26550 [Rhodopirellula sp.]|nr:hypothetical protein [Rhodopirellula sp.]